MTLAAHPAEDSAAADRHDLIRPERFLSPVRSVQLYESIRDRLLEQIRSGVWRPGDRLPSERELAQALVVSRPSLREALGSLQVARVIETRHGWGSRVSAHALKAAAALSRRGILAPSDASPASLLEARAALEPAVARLAAKRFGGEVDAELESLIELMRMSSDIDDPVKRATWNTADRMFHRRIAVHTRNPIFESMAAYVSEVMDQPLWRHLRDEMLSLEGVVAASIDEHTAIYGALVRRDAAGARRLAAMHVARVARDMGMSG